MKPHSICHDKTSLNTLAAILSWCPLPFCCHPKIIPNLQFHELVFLVRWENSIAGNWQVAGHAAADFVVYAEAQGTGDQAWWREGVAGRVMGRQGSWNGTYVLGWDQKMQIYGNFEGFLYNSALFGLVIWWLPWKGDWKTISKLAWKCANICTCGYEQLRPIIIGSDMFDCHQSHRNKRYQRYCRKSIENCDLKCLDLSQFVMLVLFLAAGNVFFFCPSW